MDNIRAIEVLEYIETFDGMNYGATNIALNKAIKALDAIDKIKDVITEEEHYAVSNSITDPHPNKSDYDAVQADKFERIWKIVSEAEIQRRKMNQEENNTTKIDQFIDKMDRITRCFQEQSNTMEEMRKTLQSINNHLDFIERSLTWNP